MKPFNQTESGYTATASNIVFTPNVDNYDVNRLDNPQRKQARYATVQANLANYRRCRGIL